MSSVIHIIDDTTPPGFARPAKVSDFAGGGGGGGGGSNADRELVVTTYRVKTAFTGASVGDTVTCTQVIDVRSTPWTVSTIWRNQTTAADLETVPAAANLELVGSQALTDAQLRASAVVVGAPALTNLDTDVGALDATAAPADGTGNYSIIAALKRGLLNWASLLDRIPALVSGRVPVDGSGVTQPIEAVALPLPTGAASETTLAALNTKIPALESDRMPVTDTAAAGTRAYNFAQATRTAVGATSSAAVEIGTLAASREVMLVASTRCFIRFGASTVTAANATDAALLALPADAMFHMRLPSGVTHYTVIRDTADGFIRFVPVL
jgi:hypothetical protein